MMRSSELLRLIGSGCCVGRIFGADVDVAVRENADIERDNRHALFVDSLGVFAEVAILSLRVSLHREPVRLAWVAPFPRPVHAGGNGWLQLQSRISVSTLRHPASPWAAIVP